MTRVLTSLLAATFAVLHVQAEDKPIKAADLHSEFRESPGAALKKYAGKVLSVEGPIFVWGGNSLEFRDKKSGGTLLRFEMTEDARKIVADKFRSVEDGRLAILRGTLDRYDHKNGLPVISKWGIVSIAEKPKPAESAKPSRPPRINRSGPFVPVEDSGVWLYPMEKGKIGRFDESDNVSGFETKFAVVRIIGKEEAVIEAFFNDRRRSVMHFEFVVQGLDTSSWVDDKIVSLADEFICTGTKKIGAKTMYVIEPNKKR